MEDPRNKTESQTPDTIQRVETLSIESQPIKTQSVPRKSVTALWDEALKAFKKRAFFKPNKYWWNGLPPRMGHNRLTLLRQSSSAEQLKALLKGLSSADIKALRTFAAINQEQAISAFRLVMVTNITIPLGFFALLHQLSPNGLGPLLLKIYGEDEAGLSILVGLGVLTLVFVLLIGLYALANLSQARDIRHLIDLHAAERGIYFGLEDMDDLDLT